jgi:hypothetical protein
MAVTATAASQDEIKEAVDSLLDEIVNGDDTHWECYAAQLSAERAQGFKIGLYKDWSASNMLYLYAQVRGRQASVKGLYAGVAQWRTRGRSVREGERPFYIYGPPSFLVRQAAAAPQPGQLAAQPVPAGQPAQPAVPQAGQQVRMYRKPPIIEVFDYTQTFADDPDYSEPDWGVPLAFGDLDTLRQLTASSPVPVRFVDIASRNEHGWLDKDGITVDASMTPGNQIWTLCHELAHQQLGHLDRVNTTAAPTPDEQSDYAVCEQEAALTQWMVMRMLGLGESAGNDITKAAGLYLRTWMKSDADGNLTPVEGRKTKRKLVKKRFDVSFRAAQRIVGAYMEAATTGAEPAAVPA